MVLVEDKEMYILVLHLLVEVCIVMCTKIQDNLYIIYGKVITSKIGKNTEVKCLMYSKAIVRIHKHMLIYLLQDKS